jgi:hypothetical protein
METRIVIMEFLTGILKIPLTVTIYVNRKDARNALIATIVATCAIPENATAVLTPGF